MSFMLVYSLLHRLKVGELDWRKNITHASDQGVFQNGVFCSVGANLYMCVLSKVERKKFVLRISLAGQLSKDECQMRRRSKLESLEGFPAPGTFLLSGVCRNI